MPGGRMRRSALRPEEEEENVSQFEGDARAGETAAVIVILALSSLPFSPSGL